MAKTPKVKKRDPSLHSRAARRQTTSPPPPNLAVKARADDTAQQPWLYHAQNAGVTKKTKVKKLTRQQRLRQQKGLEHGERNMDKLQKKVMDSKRRAKKVQSRRSEWEDLNEEPAAKSEPATAEATDETKDVTSKTWTDKMVEVELKEAMEEIEDFALPSIQGAETESEAMEVASAPERESDNPAAPPAEDVHEEEIDHVT